MDAVTVTATAAVTLARRARAVPPVTSSPSSVVASDVAVALLLLLRIELELDALGVWTWIQDRLHDGLLLAYASLKGFGHGCSRRNERMITINV